jgi:hypothetical protein
MGREVGRRGERRGQAVEKRPPGEAEHGADRSAGREPLDARTGQPLEPPDRGRLERPDVQGANKDREELADTADREPHDRSS